MEETCLKNNIKLLEEDNDELKHKIEKCEEGTTGINKIISEEKKEIMININQLKEDNLDLYKNLSSIKFEEDKMILNIDNLEHQINDLKLR